MTLFILGLIVGGGIGWYFYFQMRREISLLDEDKQMLAQEKQIVLEFMHNMVEAIGEGVGREELFRRVVHSAILSTGAFSACVFERTPEEQLRGVAVEGLFPPHRPLPDSAKLKLTTRAKFIEQVLRSEVFDVGEGLVGSVAKTGKGMLISDAREDPRIVKHDDPALEVRSCIVVPINFRETSIGVLAIVNSADGVAFNETDFSLAQSLAEQAGLAIHNLDLMAMQIEKNKLDVDLSLASSIQGMLLPHDFPSTPGLDLDARYLPAQKVGGDLYDLFQLDDGRLGVAIADVSGKGIPASILMAICQSNLRHLAQDFRSPAKVLSEMNTVMNEEMRLDMFITMIYAIIDPVRGEILMARAGHELPILFSANSESGMMRATMPGSEGMALGMVPTQLFSEVIEDKRIPFGPGDLFCLYTDGITESANQEGTEFSSSRLADAIKLLRNRSASDLNAGILETMHRFAGKEKQADDITLVSVRNLGSS